MSADEQIERLKTVAGERRWPVTCVYSDRPTSVRKGVDKRPGEMALIDAIRSGTIERVLVFGIDRLGRTLADLISVLGTCHAAGVDVYLHEQGIDSVVSNGMSMLDVVAMMALHLRQSRRDRILRGQAAARSLSIRFGRPPIAKVKVMRAKQELAAGKGVRHVARLAGISAASVSRIKNSIGSVQQPTDRR